MYETALISIMLIAIMIIESLDPDTPFYKRKSVKQLKKESNYRTQIMESYNV